MVAKDTRVYFYGSQPNPNTFGKFVRATRIEKGLNGKELAALTGVAQSDLSHLERGQRSSPSIIVIIKLAKFFELTPLELAEMVDRPNLVLQDWMAAERA